MACLRMIRNFGEEEVQDMTDTAIKAIDAQLEQKQFEIMQV